MNSFWIFVLEVPIQLSGAESREAQFSLCRLEDWDNGCHSSRSFYWCPSASFRDVSSKDSPLSQLCPLRYSLAQGLNIKHSTSNSSCLGWQQASGGPSMHRAVSGIASSLPPTLCCLFSRSFLAISCVTASRAFPCTRTTTSRSFVLVLSSL
jgi:hypothetical protein